MVPDGEAAPRKGLDKALEAIDAKLSAIRRSRTSNADLKPKSAKLGPLLADIYGPVLFGLMAGCFCSKYGLPWFYPGFCMFVGAIVALRNMLRIKL